LFCLNPEAATTVTRYSVIDETTANSRSGMMERAGAIAQKP
jgi:hypothetical protein